MRRGALLILVWLAMATCCAACTLTGDDPYPPLDETAPEVVETFPGDGWREVPTGIQPVVWFSEALEPGSVGPDSLSLVSGAYVQPVRFHPGTDADGRYRVVLEPLEPLLSGVAYQLRMGLGLADRAGNPLAAPVSVTFYTLR